MYYKYTNTNHYGYESIVKLKDNYLFFATYNNFLRVAEIEPNGSINYIASTEDGFYKNSLIGNILGNYFVTTCNGYLAMSHFDYTTKKITYKNIYYDVAGISSIKAEQIDANTIFIYCATSNNIVVVRYSISNNSFLTVDTEEGNQFYIFYDLELTQNHVIGSSYGSIYSYHRYRNNGNLSTKIEEINKFLHHKDIELNTLNSTIYLFIVSRNYNEAYDSPPMVHTNNKISVYSFNDTDGSFTLITYVSGTFSGISTRVDGSNIVFYTTKLESGSYSFCSYNFNGTTISPSESFGTTSFAQKME